MINSLALGIVRKNDPDDIFLPQHGLALQNHLATCLPACLYSV